MNRRNFLRISAAAGVGHAALGLPLSLGKRLLVSIVMAVGRGNAFRRLDTFGQKKTIAGGW